MSIIVGWKNTNSFARRQFGDKGGVFVAGSRFLCRSERRRGVRLISEPPSSSGNKSKHGGKFCKILGYWNFEVLNQLMIDS